VLVVLGATRELLGQGTLFVDMNLLFGPIATNWLIQPFGENYSFLVFVLPPGAFLVTGLLIALKNMFDNIAKNRADAEREKVIKGAKRVRTTGHIS
jgi:electron transport complex protein RnfE